MQPFDEIPRVPITRLLRQVFARGARRYEMREMQESAHRELGPVVAMGRGRFTNVFLFGPDANRAVLLERAASLSSRAPWMQIMGTIFPNGLLLRDGAEHRHHRMIMHGAFKRPVLREYVERMNPASSGASPRSGTPAVGYARSTHSRRSRSTSRPRSSSASTSGASRAA